MPFEGRPLRNARFQVGIKKAFLIFEPLKTHFSYPFWYPKLGADLHKKQQDEPKRPIRSFKDQNTAFSKPLKNHQFFNIFGSRDLPREPQEAQEGSQEATKGSKMGLQIYKKKINITGPMVENALARRSRFNENLKP